MKTATPVNRTYQNGKSGLTTIHKKEEEKVKPPPIRRQKVILKPEDPPTLSANNSKKVPTQKQLNIIKKETLCKLGDDTIDKLDKLLRSKIAQDMDMEVRQIEDKTDHYFVRYKHKTKG